MFLAEKNEQKIRQILKIIGPLTTFKTELLKTLKEAPFSPLKYINYMEQKHNGKKCSNC
jgi:hypothetical protein